MPDVINDGEIFEAQTLVVGGGIAGMTAAIETTEVGARAILVEKTPSLGGQVARMNEYFPKKCPPACGLEINLRRIRDNERLTVLTLAEVTRVSGKPGSYEVEITISPRYVNAKCTACGDCVEPCEITRPSAFDEGLCETKAIYLPHALAYPYRYVIDPQHAADPRMQKCVDACTYDAIDLGDKPKTVKARVGAIIWATGWHSYDIAKLDTLGAGKFENVISNMMMERLASPTGPTKGKITRLSDNGEIKSIGFVQCAGSRDENHLPYCSGVCCMASLKQVTYIREQYPEADIKVFYIDVRSPGRLEDFYQDLQDKEKITFIRGKVAKIVELPDGSLTLTAEDTESGIRHEHKVDMAVLALGLVPNSPNGSGDVPSTKDEYGFLVDAPGSVIPAGTIKRPIEVSSAIQDATGATIKALIAARGGA